MHKWYENLFFFVSTSSLLLYFFLSTPAITYRCLIYKGALPLLNSVRNMHRIRLSKANWLSPLLLPYSIFLHWGLTSILLFFITKGKTTVKSDQKFKDVTHISPANPMGQTWATVIAYQLPNNTLLACFRKGWLCVPSGSNSWPPFIDWTIRWSSQLSLIVLNLLSVPCSISPISFSSTADYINPQWHNLWAH